MEPQQAKVDPRVAALPRLENKETVFQVPQTAGRDEIEGSILGHAQSKEVLDFAASQKQNLQELSTEAVNISTFSLANSPELPTGDTFLVKDIATKNGNLMLLSTVDVQGKGVTLSMEMLENTEDICLESVSFSENDQPLNIKGRASFDAANMTSKVDLLVDKALEQQGTQQKWSSDNVALETQLKDFMSELDRQYNLTENEPNSSKPFEATFVLMDPQTGNCALALIQGAQAVVVRAEDTLSVESFGIGEEASASSFQMGEFTTTEHEQADYDTISLSLGPNDRLILATDAYTDLRYDKESLETVAQQGSLEEWQENKSDLPEKLHKRFQIAVQEKGNQMKDDALLVVVSRK